MSIIYDALKKVERLGNIVSESQKLDKESRPKLQKRKFQVYFLYALVVFSGFFIASVFFNFLKPRHLPLAAVAPLPKEESVMLLKIKEIKPAEPNPLPRPSLVLNGIFYSQEEGYALINNQILKVGDTIKGAVVKRIGEDEVELELSGEVIRLSSKD